MGRSVSYPSGAASVCFRTIDTNGDIEGNWEMLVEDVKESSLSQWPSFYKSDKWLDSEDHALLENRFAYIGVSEYCGLVSVWLAPKEVEYNEEGLRDRWIENITPTFEKFFGELVKVGTFSNGEGVYERKASK